MQSLIKCLKTLILSTSLAVISSASLAAGLLTPIDSSLPVLQIKSHHVEVVIEDGYAITQVDQVFSNPHSVDLEAKYSFPLPEKASVGEFTYWIDGVPITGEVVEKQHARDIYQQEKAAGREVALMEQDAHYSFDMHVYPVKAAQNVRIRLVYIQPVNIDSSIGRYVYPLEEGGVDEHKTSFWSFNDVVQEEFSFNLNLRSSYPVDMLRLPEHSQALIQSQHAQQWNARLTHTLMADDSENLTQTTQPVHSLNKDIVVYWRLQEGLPGSVEMVTYKPDANGRGTFMLTVTPGDDLPTIQQGRDWVFVLDISGSMQGKYHSLVEGVRQGLRQLPLQDRFRVVLFNNTVTALTPSFQAVNAENVQAVLTQLDNIQPHQGTHLYAGLQNALQGLDADRPSAVILVTDGEANVGPKEKKDFIQLLQQKDVRLFTFVMGNGANRPLLQSMADVSNGFAMSVSNSDDISGKLLLATSKLNHQAYRDVAVTIDGVKVKDLTPANIGNVYRGEQLIVLGHYWGAGQARIEVSGQVGPETKNYHSQLTFPAQSDLHPELERLWAFAKIEDLQNSMDYLGQQDVDTEQAITDLALEYGLVTPYTSMVVVREDVFEQLGLNRNNAQRVNTEHLAREARENTDIRDHRQDAQQPMFTQQRATTQASSGSGAGSLNWIWALLLLPLLINGLGTVREKI